MPPERPGPAGGRRDENRRRRIASLCAAAEELFAAEGIAEVTVDRIASRAGVAKGSFYRYVADIEELVATMLAPLQETLRDAIGRAAAELAEAKDAETLTGTYRRLAAELAASALAHPRLVTIYLQEARAPGVGARRPIRALADEIERSAVELTRAARAHGLLRSDYDLRVGALAAIGAADRILFAHLTGDSPGDPRDVIDSLVSVILDGVRGR